MCLSCMQLNFKRVTKPLPLPVHVDGEEMDGEEIYIY